jgi:hypothetical protein
MIEMAIQSKSDKFIVQTDEFEFFEYFKSKFPDTIRFTELQMINKNINSYVMPNKNKVQFIINFIAAIRAISQVSKLILNTGNIGLWTMFFRGNTKDVWQYHGVLKTFKKLNYD